jgi:hypothetical protein
MRITQLIVAGSVLALAATGPVLAKNAESRKTDDKSTSSATCHAYQKADDGSWIERPCEESGGGSTQHKPVAKGAEDEPLR